MFPLTLDGRMKPSRLTPGTRCVAWAHVADPLLENASRPSGTIAVVRCAAALAAAMGVGRFVYTPLLPIMTAQAGLSPGSGAVIAAVNYVGYLVGAVAMAVWPRLAARVFLRSALLGLAASEAGMALTDDDVTWAALRFVAGFLSAVVFIAATVAVTRSVSDGGRIGLGLAGVGAGIAASGLLVVAGVTLLDWRGFWFAAAAGSLVLAAIAWPLGVSAGVAATPVAATTDEPPPGSGHGSTTDGNPGTSIPATRGPRRLLAVYFLEGLGYIVVGTFIVAGVRGDPLSPLPALVWVGTGLAAVPATVLWGKLADRVGTRRALLTCLTVQTAGTVLPAAGSAPWLSFAGGIAFGSTFLGIVALTMRLGTTYGMPRAAAVLTSVYGVGQIIGPLAVIPVIGDGYRVAFLVAAAVLAVATALTLRLPERH